MQRGLFPPLDLVVPVRRGELPVEPIASLAEARLRPSTQRPAFVEVDTVDPAQVVRSEARAVGGRSVLQVLDLCMDATLARDVDAICFAPLNKHAMKLGGLVHEDELHHFAEYLGVKHYFCEFNTLGDLWTARISSHIPLKEAASYLNVERIMQAGAKPIGWVQMLCELQRDWNREGTAAKFAEILFAVEGH